MKFSKMIFVLTIAASAIFICMMGSSYAYYTATATDISVLLVLLIMVFQ